ncbi:DUF3923 family protein [Lysinibacillus sp. G4S2]|nr:DUF3923 family protein [Lysinibacillus sp. G4S2]MDM5250310.1 DUF3923 family protein [Lysinibacillus sp. G4S2]
MKIWWVINIAWLFIFATGAIIIGVREVDGAGVVVRNVPSLNG